MKTLYQILAYKRKHSLHSTDTAKLNFIYAVLDRKQINNVNGAAVIKLIINTILKFNTFKTNDDYK